MKNLGISEWRSTPPLKQLVRLMTAILVALLVGFCFFASSLFITLLLAAFLSIVVTPLVHVLEKARLPRSLAVGVVILAGTACVGFALYSSYNALSNLSDDFPRYATRIREVISPLSDKIQQVQDSARTLGPEATSKKIPEVRIRESISWTNYLVRGVGSLWGAMLVAGIVPFLMYFMLLGRDKMYYCVEVMFGQKIDVPDFLSRLNRMVRAYVLGNLVIALLLSGVSILVFWAVGLKTPIMLGIASGVLNVIPFVGSILALAVPILAGLLQFGNVGPFLVIGAAVIVLHLIAANFLLPRFVGSSVDVGPVAGTVGILFWSWLWGIPGLLLAIPLTAFVKMIADSSHSLRYLSNFLAPDPNRCAFPKEKQPLPAPNIVSEAGPQNMEGSTSSRPSPSTI